jgi:uncharacterized protein (DUF983 family)
VGRLRAVIGQRCPRCYRGAIFRGLFAMNERCAVCQLHFAREEGYFTGAMIFSYVLAVPLLAILVLVLPLATGWSFEEVLAAGGLGLVILSPALFRYSRALWIHLDRLIDPGD